RLIAKNPAQRYQNAAELLVELRRLHVLADSGQLRNQPMPSPYPPSPAPAPETTIERLPHSPSHRRWGWRIAAGLGVLALSVGASRWMRSEPAAWFQTNRLTGIPGSGASHIEVLSPDGRYIAYDT